MDTGTRWQMTEEVLATGRRIAVVTTGGGSLLVSWLLNHPGASRAIVEAQIPYHTQALNCYLESSVAHRVEEQTAVHLAAQAHRRVTELTGGAGGAVGFGCTAALATDRTRRGCERAVVAVLAGCTCHVCSIGFAATPGDRLEQEELLSQAGLLALRLGCGLHRERGWPRGLQVRERSISLSDPLALLYSGDAGVVERFSDGRTGLGLRRRHRLLLPGSFNPLHTGHEGLLGAAEQASGRDGAYELSIENVDKPTLTRPALERRLDQFAGKRAVLITRAATFSDKVQLFPGGVFAVGYDTAARVLEPRYYRGPQTMSEALDAMAAARCSYLVAGRLSGETYRGLADLHLPAAHSAMFRQIPQASFRLDISSSRIRAGTNGDRHE